MIALPARDEVHLWLGSRADFAREVLHSYIGGDPVIRRTPLGKPSIEGGPHFSISRTAGLCAVAISDSPVGVDIERIAPLPDLDALVECTLSSFEAARLTRLAGDEERTRFFYRCWTRKEAGLKAAGTGLSVDPRTFDTTIPGAWWWSEPAMDGVAIAIATRGPSRVSMRG